MSSTMKVVELADRQRAFVGLLACPLVTPWSNEALYLLVHRHFHALQTWCQRVDYRLIHVEQSYRLRRLPLTPTPAEAPPDATPETPAIAPEAPPETSPANPALGVTIPPQPETPTRGQLLLRLYAAACLDGQNRSSVTLQDLSNEVRNSAAARHGWPYNPESRLHRKMFIEAVEWLVAAGVLEERTSSEMLLNWENTGEGIGGGYLVHHDALMLLLDTEDITVALNSNHATESPDNRGTRLLRMLIEQQAIEVASLSAADREYLFGPQRSRLVAQAEEMTGGTVEVHSDLVVLSLHADLGVPEDVLLQFPQSTTLDWAALAFIGILAANHGQDSIPREAVATHGKTLYDQIKGQLTKKLKESPGVLTSQVGTRLEELGLLRRDKDSWQLTGLAARYREAQLLAEATHESGTGNETEALTLW
ncbi:DUF2398 family protein [Mobiluncus mulieris]|uniref:DUF2398 family protein n=1 Tax=Mobiluncus mulieris TaxID=2052 RepID=UPI00242DA424|nr:DUF2398 family protein [Mobiluncus mulieris]